ncbi:MAG: hypothetical protein IPJ41_17900 [Phycisphaerales bacterium]|nr:hypothetical protein [Phycisphaerales bacterium]
MVVRAVRDLPGADRCVFVVQREHVDCFQIDEVLARYLPTARVVVAPGLTEGQACSVALAEGELDPEGQVIVGACDNTHVYSRDRLAGLMGRTDLDCLVWTYRGEPRVAANPRQYGWVRSRQAVVEAVSCKAPISDNPLGDHVVSGFFWFRTAGMMLDGIAALVRDNQRVNNEFYMDSVPNVLLREGRRVEVFEVEKYIGWGTPADVRDYQLWEEYFAGLKRLTRPPDGRSGVSRSSNSGGSSSSAPRASLWTSPSTPP